ncbi:carboxypeptidase B isoform X2 [Frankliniella occidentalis]|uniref:Carboxypeptidase B isoform X2 n=1 Tax=Frankliniella occidentalis TaxID=133901 RepID=A0A9C6WN43_FRAOC|nr:carboxypeptidase B isoform X2 [Frankliniella occidentalis]
MAPCSALHAGALLGLAGHLLMHLLLLLSSGARAQEVSARSYTNYTVLRVTPTTDEQVRTLRGLEDRGVQWWTPPRRNFPCDAMISPDKRNEVVGVFTSLQLQPTVLHQDLQEYQARVDKELQPLLTSRFAPGDAYINNQRYLDFEEITTYIKELAANHPNKVRLHNIGFTHQKRNMTVVQLSNCFECKYKAVWVDAGIHAREWIAPATALFALSQLAENETSTAEMREHQDWFILPVANPDGYEFTHKKDRMWRKTRSNTSVPGCYGADPNRNFDFHWNEIGASSNPCSETYAGRKAFSEIEALNIRNFLYANKERFKLYISYHAYGNFLLYPWGYTADNPDDWKLLRSVAEKVNAAMVQAGSQEYTIGSSTQVLYPAAGGSDDWAKGVAGIPLSYTIELPGFDFGFQLPPSYIDQVARQSFEGLRVFAAEAKKVTRGRSRSPTSRPSQRSFG